MNISQIDKNFQSAKVGDVEYRFASATNTPFSLEGLPFREQSKLHPFRRLPDSIEKGINEGAFWLGYQTAGAAVRFRTDSKSIAVRAVLAYSSDMNHMPRAGSAGFDLYRGSGAQAAHVGTFQPNRDQTDVCAPLIDWHDGSMCDWILNLPLYGGISRIEIGVLPGATVEPPTPHRTSKPVLFYGSSITQGGCASRPGNAYTSMLCRAVDAEQINLGFSGSGRGEPAVAELIASLDLSAFVMDYDHNAPTPEHLEKTHEPFFQVIRKAHPELPVIMLSMCNSWQDNPKQAIVVQRREIIRATYNRAIAAGDKNVYFIDGETLFGRKNRGDCTVDRCHPNDLGFYRMYKHTLPVLKKALGLTR